MLTIAFLGFVNNKHNLCYVEKPVQLYDEYTGEKFYYKSSETNKLEEGLNPQVLTRILQMIMKI